MTNACTALFDLLCPPEVQERLAAGWATHLRRMQRLGRELSPEDQEFLAARSERRAHRQGNRLREP